MLLAVETKVKGEVMTSSPGLIPRTDKAACNAAVPELNATANFDCVHLSGQVHNYHNVTWFDWYKRVYWAAMTSHCGNYGIINRHADADKLITTSGSITTDIQILFRCFMNETSDDYAINTYVDLFVKWGNPWTGTLG